MQPFTLDLPLLIIGLLWLAWLRLRKPDYRFQVACQLVGTFWAQYTFIVSWSLARLVPFFAASALSVKKLQYGQLFVPFVIYVFFGGLISSLFWDIPTDAKAAYGESRIFMHLAIFISLVLTTRAFALAMANSSGPLLMWKALIVIGLIHGLAVVYQYIAWHIGLPLLGISRAHGMTLEYGIADVASFAIGEINVVRPGGLAGEPRYSAALFGIVLLATVISGRPPSITKKWIHLSVISIGLSSIGFIGAFSTSGYVGFVIAFAALLIFSLIYVSKLIKYVVFVALLVIILNHILTQLGYPPLLDLFVLRSIERVGTLEGHFLPNQAAFDLLLNNALIFFLGTGISGGTFYIQDILNLSFEFTLMPSIGVLGLFLEVGLIGVLLLFIPFFMLILKSRVGIHKLDKDNTWKIGFLLALGISSMAFSLSSVGHGLNYPVAIGSILGAVNYLQRKKSRTKNHHVTSQSLSNFSEGTKR